MNISSKELLVPRRRLLFFGSFFIIACILWNHVSYHTKVRFHVSSPHQISNSTTGATCGCSGLYISTSELQELENSAVKTSFVALRKPRRRFHSNHWFHNGEYFLSMHANSQLMSIVSSGDTIVLMANEVKFVKQLTNTAAFFLTLALSPDGKAKKLEVYEPSYIDRRVDESGSKWGSFSSYGPGFVYSPYDSDPYRHFVAPAFGDRVIQSGRKSCRCGKLVDFVGQAPTKSSEWFKSVREVGLMRGKIAALCLQAGNSSSLDSTGLLKTWTEPSGNSTGSRVFRMLIYQRNVNRRFVDLENLARSLVGGLGNGGSAHPWVIQTLMHSESMLPCMLYSALESSDIFLTTHGFQATALMFMRPDAVLIEIFPYKYWKNSYVDLSAQFGLHHRWTQNRVPTSLSRQILRLIPQNTCMASNRCRSMARGDSIAMPQDHVDLVLNTARALANGELGHATAYRWPERR